MGVRSLSSGLAVVLVGLSLVIGFVAGRLAVEIPAAAAGGSRAASSGQPASRCVPTELVASADIDVRLLEKEALVRSQEHARLWFLAARLVDSRVAVWALDDPTAPNWIASVSSVAEELTPELPNVADVGPKPPAYWVDSKGNRRDGSWRSVTAGISEYSDGAREAWNCVRWDSLYR